MNTAVASGLPWYSKGRYLLPSTVSSCFIKRSKLPAVSTAPLPSADLSSTTLCSAAHSIAFTCASCEDTLAASNACTTGDRCSFATTSGEITK